MQTIEAISTNSLVIANELKQSISLFPSTIHQSLFTIFWYNFLNQKKEIKMQASFVLEGNELDYSFVDKLKVLFGNKKIELLVSETDDTKYLSTSKSNQNQLLSSINNIENNTNLVVANPKIFE